MCLPLAVLGPIIAAAGSLGAAGINAAASSGAANAQKDAANDALDLQKQMFWQGQKNYQQAQENMRPWLDAGRSSLTELMAQMQGGYFDRQFNPSQLANDPGYQFRMSEGQKALERSAAARGLTNSGGALKSLARYSQGLASDEFQNAWNRNQAENTGRYNRLANMAGLGQTQSQALGTMNSQNTALTNQSANSMSSLYGALGNANAAGQIGVGNAISSGLNSLGGLFNMYGGQQSIPTQASQGTPYYLADPAQVPNETPSYGYGAPLPPSYTGPYS